ncbi:hypothetical protein MMC28_000473 [Mycoblastus sanguinarius]|nr:hypothetical protein [Mycoblastus sanguinarius]
MRPSLQALVLAIIGLDCAFAQPAHHAHENKHKRQVNYNNPALYQDVDWSTVNYGGDAAPAAPATPAPITTSAAPAPVVQNNAVAQKPASSTAAAAPTSSSTPSSGGTSTGSSSGGKRGLAYNSSSPSLDMFDSYSELTWAFDWDSDPAGAPAKYQFVPTMFSTLPVHTTDWDANANKAISGSGTHYLMSFNEPDMPLPQANMPISVAVPAWNQYMKGYASNNVKLGSPSVSNGVGTNPTTGQPMGLDWLTPFLKACTGCPVGFVPVHWYGCTNSCSTSDDVALFQKQMTDAMNAAISPVDGSKLPVWIPEFQCFGDQEAFLQQVLPWLDGQSQIERYAYFMVTDGILTQGNSVSTLGQKYAS